MARKKNWILATKTKGFDDAFLKMVIEPAKEKIVKRIQKTKHGKKEKE